MWKEGHCANVFGMMSARTRMKGCFIRQSIQLKLLSVVSLNYRTGIHLHPYFKTIVARMFPETGKD